jgi:hypothetical protein
VNVHEEDSIHNLLEKITVRAGGLIIWSSEMPHCNYPNDSSRFRMNQYIKMFPAQEQGKGATERRAQMRRIVPPNLSVDETGQKLLGLESWNLTSK